MDSAVGLRGPRANAAGEVCAQADLAVADSAAADSAAAISEVSGVKV